MDKRYEGTAALEFVQEAVREMWKRCAELTDGRLQRASPNDTVHFLHEEAGEVVKCAMAMGLMGDKSYVRSAEVQATVYTWEDLLGEIGDVLLMAITLAEAFDVNAGVCLQMSLDKFYARAQDHTQTKEAGAGGHEQPERPEG